MVHAQRQVQAVPSQQPLSTSWLILIALLLPQPVWMAEPPPTGCVTLGKSHTLSEPLSLLL